MNFWNMLSALDAPSFTMLGAGAEIKLNWIGVIIRWLIESIGITGVGIIVFTLALKLLVLPLDIYSRVSGRKQSLKMGAMKDKLEKLQKQYANDKVMYNQKMQELYKKENVSMMSSCLPTIVTLAIFLIVFNQFSAYSQYANLYTYNRMIEAYNGAVMQYCVEEHDYSMANRTYLDENGNLCYVFDTETVVKSTATDNTTAYDVYQSLNPDKYIYYTVNKATGELDQYKLDTEKCYNANKAAIDALIEASKTEEKPEGDSVADATLLFMQTKGRDAASEYFLAHQTGFLWVKNIWYADTTMAHPVQDYTSFVNSITSKVEYNGTAVKLTETPAYRSATAYNEITYNLTHGENPVSGQYNGYFILVVLSIGLMVLSQVIAMRGQKKTNDVSNPSAQTSQKIMMVVMPVLFGFFAFRYSAAFSIYMIINTFISIIVTLVSNFAIDRKFSEYERLQIQEKYSRKIKQVTGQAENGKKQSERRFKKLK